MGVSLSFWEVPNGMAVAELTTEAFDSFVKSTYEFDDVFDGLDAIVDFFPEESDEWEFCGFLAGDDAEVVAGPTSLLRMAAEIEGANLTALDEENDSVWAEEFAALGSYFREVAGRGNAVLASVG